DYYCLILYDNFWVF
nr:immunoglobulin light chain junction region [Macaca mulatta]